MAAIRQVSAKPFTFNESLSRFRLSYLCHRTPGLRWIGKIIPPDLHFRWIRTVARVAYHLYHSDRRRVRYMRQAMAGKFSPPAVRAATKKNIVYRKWAKTLVHGWPSWAERCEHWAALKGEEHLERALRGGQGAILLSGHGYGFSSIIAPVLSQRGYSLRRTGQGVRGDPVKRWGREWSRENWDYDTFGGDFWQHVRAIHRMHRAVRQNEIVHLLVRGAPYGKPELEIDFFYQRFFLDPFPFRIIETLQAPVLPCFAVCDDSGRLVIDIHPALPPATGEIIPVFGPLYSNYIRTKPEFAKFWRRMVREQESW